MPQLGNAKHRIGQRLGSGATTGEGTQNLLCAYLAAGVLVSLALNAAFGLWWADPAVALAIAALADQRRPPNLARRRLLRQRAHQRRKQHRAQRRLLPLTAETAHSLRPDLPTLVALPIREAQKSRIRQPMTELI